MEIWNTLPMSGQHVYQLFACWVIFYAFVVGCWLFSKLTFSKKIFPEYYQRDKKVQIQTMTDSMSVLIWFQIVCICYQQTTKVSASKERVKIILFKMHTTVLFYCHTHRKCTKYETSVVCCKHLQTVWTQIMPDKMSDLIWIQTV